jgi:hypothetical protein
VVERKDLTDLVRSFTVERKVFVDRPSADVSLPSPAADNFGSFESNQVALSIFASETQPDYAVIDGRAEGIATAFTLHKTSRAWRELVASYLYQVHLYHWLEANGYGSSLTDGDP